MKKILTLGFLLLSVYINAQTTVNYTISNDVITNPERGFFRASDTGTSSSNYSLLNQTELTNMRLNENISVIIREFWLNDFKNSSTISQSYLNNMQTDFNRLRSAGVKAIIRFGYSKSSTNEDTELQQASKTNILNHIVQLTPILNQNKDVIVSIQAGFIGTYGEWWATGTSPEFGHKDSITTSQWNNRGQILTAMEVAFDSSIPLQVRYLSILYTLRPNGTNRIGLYNDAFLDNWCNSGTFPCPGGQFGTPLQVDQNYLINLTKNLPMTGETDRFQVNNVQLPSTTCPNAALELDKYNWSLINTEYQQQVITHWQDNGCYTEFKKKLGYRYELINSTVSSNNVLTLNIKNTGYANVFKYREAFLVLRNLTTSQEYRFQLDTDLRNWITNQVTTIVQDINYNVPSGQYQLYLSLPDPDNNIIPYAVRCANLSTWVAISGYNDLKQIVSINNLGVQIFVNNNTISLGNLTGAYTIKIYDLLGRIVKKNSLDISTLKSGIYIIKVVNDGKVYTKKIYKE